MDTLLKIVGFGGPAVLAVMGFVVIDRPPKGTRGRWIWYGAFSVVAAISVTPAVLDARSTEHRLNEMLLGGDNYPYFFASYDPKKLGGNAQLILVSEKHTPLFDVAFSIHRAPTKEMSAQEMIDAVRRPLVARSIGTLLSGAHETDIFLPPGTYQVNFAARNGNFVQIVRFQEFKNQMVFVTDVSKFGSGEMLKKGPRPEGYVE